MTPQEIDAWLVRTLEDRSLSRQERHALAGFVAAAGPGLDRAAVRARAFALARAAPAAPGGPPVLDWLEGVVRALAEAEPADRHGAVAEAHFSPGDDCWRAIVRWLDRARRSADVCVFTITDDRLAGAVLTAHRRGVAVRVVTDNSKADDAGSDVPRLRAAGVPVRIDRSPFHMHHKFAVFDGAALLTGSYNWTRGAASDNEENLIVTDDPRLVPPFVAAFERLWDALA